MILQKSKIFAMQIDASTDINSKAQLLAFIRYGNNGKIMKQFLLYRMWNKNDSEKYFVRKWLHLSSNGLKYAEMMFRRWSGF